ncbi:class III lanthipeptide [Streptomyces sp. NPDC059070]
MEILKLQAMDAKAETENNAIPTTITLTTVTTSSTAI